MDFLFSRTYKYSINKPIDNVFQDFSIATNRKWTDLSANITGKLNDDKSFKFTHKWTFGYIRGIFGSDFATIKGRIKENGRNTVIETTLRPNPGLVFFIYLMAILFLCELFGVRTMLDGPKTEILLILSSFGLILFGLIIFMTNGLRNTFERVFDLRTD